MAADRKVVAAYLEDAAADLQGAEALITLGNRHAAYHLQQAAEKLVKAVRLDRGLVPTKEHRIEILIDGLSTGEPKRLPDGDPWRERLAPLSPLSEYATAFRYPTMSGALRRGPDGATLKAWVSRLAALLDVARSELLGE